MLMNPSPRGKGPTTTPSAMSPVDRLYVRGYPGERRDIQDCRTGTGSLSWPKSYTVGHSNRHNTAQNKLEKAILHRNIDGAKNDGFTEEWCLDKGSAWTRGGGGGLDTIFMPISAAEPGAGSCARRFLGTGGGGGWIRVLRQSRRSNSGAACALCQVLPHWHSLEPHVHWHFPWMFVNHLCLCQALKNLRSWTLPKHSDTFLANPGILIATPPPPPEPPDRGGGGGLRSGGVETNCEKLREIAGKLRKIAGKLRHCRQPSVTLNVQQF